jgi:aspartate-semialdehyde dehydrogenase
MQENGYNEEEMKMVKETHKIWRAPDVAITATCIRVPVMRAHAESINLELEHELSEDEVNSSGHSCVSDHEQETCAHVALGECFHALLQPSNTIISCH